MIRKNEGGGRVRKHVEWTKCIMVHYTATFKKLPVMFYEIDVQAARHTNAMLLKACDVFKNIRVRINIPL